MEIRTNRLTIKPFSPTDADAALNLLTDSRIKETYILPDFDKREDAILLFQRLLTLSMEERRFSLFY